MTREQLLHAIRAACDVLQADEVLVVGSQAILASFPDTELPESATRSREADIASLAGDDEAASHLLSGVLGEDSGFDHLNGFFVDGVSADTAQLPAGWRERAVRLETRSIARGRTVAGICPAPEDLCVAKLAAFREKDQEFVRGLIAGDFVDPGAILAALRTVSDLDPRVLERVTGWLGSTRRT
jgi:hypothetical protein